MEIKVLGAGCASCKKLYEITLEAVRKLGIVANVVYVTDLEQIMQSGIIRMPGLIVDGKVKSMGRVPKIKEVKQIISDEI
ncbi:MAG: thioredoxin family protein [Christensenellales bacterium]|jgi:small redox-active disulfide protein 2